MQYILSLFGQQKPSFTNDDLQTLLGAMGLTLNQLKQAAITKADGLIASAKDLRKEEDEFRKKANAKGQEASEKELNSQALKDAANKIS